MLADSLRHNCCSLVAMEGNEKFKLYHYNKYLRKRTGTPKNSFRTLVLLFMFEIVFSSCRAGFFDEAILCTEVGVALMGMIKRESMLIVGGHGGRGPSRATRARNLLASSLRCLREFVGRIVVLRSRLSPLCLGFKSRLVREEIVVDKAGLRHLSQLADTQDTEISRKLCALSEQGLIVTSLFRAIYYWKALFDNDAAIKRKGETPTRVQIKEQMPDGTRCNSSGCCYTQKGSAVINPVTEAMMHELTAWEGRRWRLPERLAVGCGVITHREPPTIAGLKPSHCYYKVIHSPEPAANS
ncbi:Protein of unknown function [Gryllus bimaculatus]|nr:Protein of unknown function [Gryllus bimaculatus]